MFSVLPSSNRSLISNPLFDDFHVNDFSLLGGNKIVLDFQKPIIRVIEGHQSPSMVEREMGVLIAMRLNDIVRNLIS